ncbi:MAG TPA: M23 family metallopeptidase [Xanthobacteraceae bacterium]|nr:M23 family metallopeptidase [Xanthobacteraceae bacterium]
MAFLVVSSPARMTSRLAAIAVVSAGIAGCSGDVSRFGDNPFTGTISSNVPPAAVGQSYAATSSYSPAPAANYGAATAAPRPGNIQSQPLPPMQAASAPLPAPSHPVHQAAVTPTPAVRGTAASGQPHASSTVHVVGSGETLYGVARKYGKSRFEIARANGLDPNASIRIGQRLVIPGAAQARVRTASLTPTAPVHVPQPPVAPQAKPAAAAKPPAPAPKVAARTPASDAAPVETARLSTPASDAAAEQKESQPAATGAVSFRWPVRGRVIAGFGPKPNGQQNDGINVAVPEGTSIKAAEDGVVAYAGNELKGYGNLVLVRHPNGYVTAYAHASELKVKRGDKVKRGQIIALAGQTGGVSSPQLHFEVRKGSTPVDPLQMLASN